MLCTSFKLALIFSDYDNEKVECTLVFQISGKVCSEQEDTKSAAEKWHAPTLPEVKSSNLFKLPFYYVFECLLEPNMR